MLEARSFSFPFVRGDKSRATRTALLKCDLYHLKLTSHDVLAAEEIRRVNATCRVPHRDVSRGTTRDDSALLIHELIPVNYA